MAGHSTQGVKNARRQPPAPPHVTVLDNTVINEVARQLLDEFLPHAEQIEVGVENLEPFLKSYSRLKYISVATAATFAKTVAIPDTPITVHRGGGVKAWATVENGQISMPHPILLDGFTAFGPIEIGGWTLFHGLAGIDRLFAIDGQVHAALCCIPFVQPNVTAEILNNPVAKRLFPQQEVEPVTLTQLMDLLENPPSGGIGPDSKQIILDALHEAALQVQFYPDRKAAALTPHSALTSLRIFVNVPDLLHTVETEAYRRFDFSGILNGSEVTSHDFPLSLLPRPQNIYFSPDSRADVKMSYDPEAKATDITFNDIHAQVFLKNWFTRNPMKLAGNMHATIEAGGKTHLHFEHLSVRFPFFPSEADGRNFISLEAVFNGHVFLHMDEIGKLQLDRLALQLENIVIRTPDGQSIGLGTDVNSVAGQLAGKLSASYDVSNNNKLEFSWETDGEADLQSGRDDYQFDGMTFAGRLAAYLVDGRLRPQLDQSSLRLAAKRIANTNGVLNITEPWLAIDGGEKIERGETMMRTGSLRAGGDALTIAGVSLQPRLNVDLRHTSDPTGDELVGFGTASLQSEEIPISIKSRIHGKADDAGYLWDLDFDEPLIAGSLVASGRLSVGRRGSWADARTIRSFSKFSIRTQEPYNIAVDGRRVAGDISISGVGDDSYIHVTVDAGSLPAELRGRLVLDKRAASDRVSGDYLFERDSVPLPAGIELNEVQAAGRYVTVPLRQINDRPAAQIQKGKIKAHVAGGVSGAVDVEYSGSLSYDPKTRKISFKFDPTETSQINLGPLQDHNHLVTLDGHANVEGTIATRLGQGTTLISGRHFGLHNGQVFIVLNPSTNNHASQRLPFLDKFWLSADRFTSDLDSIQVAGDGLSISTDIYLNPLGLRLGNGARKRSLAALGITRLPLSDPQYWPVLKEVSQAIQSATTGATE